jgi:DNA/RNA-binding domain of Phe-tRNA-synthetase-like protein
MNFGYASVIRADFPELVSGVVRVGGITNSGDVARLVADFEAIAQARLATDKEGDFPEIQAWRRAFAKMGMKPTQYRCASEALLRRFRKERALPRLHPLIDLCNAISLAFATPVAAFDVAKISGGLEVRRARGDETYQAFSGEVERPEAGEVIFADDAGRAHARRWTNRQSGYSAVRDETSTVLIVAEAMHETAAEDVRRLTAEVAKSLADVWSVAAAIEMVSR